MKPTEDDPGDDAIENGDPSRRESRLIHRALERVATREDWAVLDAIAASDPDVMHRLARHLRDECELGALGAGVATAVNAIELPVLELVAPHRPRILRDSGWLAAAALFLLWLTTFLSREPDAVRPASRHDAGLGTLAAASDSPPLVRVLDGGNTTESDVSRVLVEAIPGSEGWELLYLRKSFERVKVARLFDTVLDDGGNVSSVRVLPNGFTKWEEF